MRAHHALFLALLALLGCTPSAPPTPTSTPVPKSNLKMESFVIVDALGGKAESARVHGDDTIKTEVVVSGFSNDGSGHSVGTVALEIDGPDGNSIQHVVPDKQVFSEPFVDGGRVTLTPTMIVGATDPNGTYKMKVTVVDQSADLMVEKALDVTIEGGSGANPTPASTSTP